MPDRVRLRSREAVTLVLISLIRGDREQGRLLAAQSLEPGEELDIRRAGREIVRSAGSRGNAARSHNMFSRRRA
jgi:hypothetical protein